MATVINECHTSSRCDSQIPHLLSAKSQGYTHESTPVRCVIPMTILHLPYQ